jgi:Protein of unknown function (DUF1552)
MMRHRTRREFLRDMGVSAAALPFISNLPSLAFANQRKRKQRLILMFSPNGIVPDTFWPDAEVPAFCGSIAGALAAPLAGSPLAAGALPTSYWRRRRASDYNRDPIVDDRHLTIDGSRTEFTLTPDFMRSSLDSLKPFADRTLMVQGLRICMLPPGSTHARGIGCLWTGIELFPGNHQGGDSTPNGWPKGPSIDQEIKFVLQDRPETRTRFGSLEFGVNIPDDLCNIHTRMVYAGPNQPLPPLSSPYQMFSKLYGHVRCQDALKSILDDLRDDLRRVASAVSNQDRQLLEEHTTFVRQMEQDLAARDSQIAAIAPPQLEQGIQVNDDNMPKISKMQIDLLVNAMANDFARMASFQIVPAVSDVRLTFLGITESHHNLSHKTDRDVDARVKLNKITRWYCEQMAYMAKRLAETPEPGGPGSMLDNTAIIWSNELANGDTHSIDNIPFVVVGNGLDWRMGRYLKHEHVPHNRLLLSIAHAFGHHITQFGNKKFCYDGPLGRLT